LGVDFLFWGRNSRLRRAKTNLVFRRQRERDKLVAFTVILKIWDREVSALNSVGNNVDIFTHFIDDSSNRFIEAEQIFAFVHLVATHLNFEVELASLLKLPKVVVGLHVLKIVRSLHYALGHLAV
jgi:hypothetical protein